MRRAVFAIPGDKDQRTGGYIYDAAVLQELRAQGVEIEHLELPDSFPDPSSQDMNTTFEALSAVPESTAIIVDGLALGAMDPERMSTLRAPVIGMVHHPLGLEAGLSGDRSEALLRNERAVLRHAAHVIVPSAHIKQTVIERLDVVQERVSVAYPGFAPASLPKDIVPRAAPPLILSVGLLARRKGHDVLLKALARLKDLEWQAKVIGKPQDVHVAHELAEQAELLGISERVNFAGEVDERELTESYRAAKIFALATRYEGYGMVLSEAMLHGLPVISCDVGAVPETVGDAGVLVAPDDPDGLASALRRVLECPGEADRLAEKARARAQSLPNWTQTAQVFAKVLEQVERCSG